MKTKKTSKNWSLWFLIGAIFFLAVNTALADNALPWTQWVQQLRVEAVNQGIKGDFFDKIFADISAPQSRILHFNRTQPEKRITYLQYRNSRINSLRIKLGQNEYQKKQALLESIGQDFHVDSCTVVAIWGIETSYGRYMGEFPVIRALATLAYDSDRANYFRAELLTALHILSEGHVSLNKFKGEWAGASGHPQFMPSSWRKYAIDYDQDGRKDIWGDYADAFASIANYLAHNGWQQGQPFSITVRVPDNFDSALANLKVTKTVSEWLKIGVKPDADIPSGDVALMASIIRPSGGPDYMVFNNFRVIMKYNNSTFYAGSVGYLADKICKRL